MRQIKNNTWIKKKLGFFAVIVITVMFLSSNFLLIKNTSEDNEFLCNKEETNENNDNSKIIQEEKIKENLANMKGFFTKNQGQLENDEIYFTYSSQDKTFGFSESSVLIKLSKILDDNTSKSSIIKITFENSNKVIPKGIEELSHKSNYFIGNDKSKWKSNVPNYEKIVYENLYDGIDLVYYFNEIGLKYDWIVKPNAEPNKIIEKFEGVEVLKIDNKGELIIKTKAGELREKTPYSYQNIFENVIGIDVSYKIIEENKITYGIGDYDSSRELIIDPLIYSTFIGEGDWDESFGIALDSKNNAYVTGHTNSSDFQTTPGCYDDSHNGSYDVFVFKLNPNGSDLLYSTFIGGGDLDYGFDIVLDSENNAYIIGETKSTDFPTTSECLDDSHNGGYDVFVLQLNASGSDLLYSTFVGGSEDDFGKGIVLDTENNTYLTGYTLSSDFPTTPGCFNDSHSGGSDVFVFKLKSDGSNSLYSTFVGGSEYDYGFGIVLDSGNNTYITGRTESSDFPTTSGCFNDSYSWGGEVFVFKLNQDGSDLLYSTYIGGGNYDRGSGIALDSDNNTYITGYTLSSDFPTTSSCFDDSHNGDYDVFVLKLNPNGSDLLYSTFLGGSNRDYGQSIALDSNNNTYITGKTNSTNFPTTCGCFDDSHNGDYDVFLFKLNQNGSDLLYSTFVGEGEYDSGDNIAIDSEENAYITGMTLSSNFPTTSDCFDNSHNGKKDVFVLKLNLSVKLDAKIDSISPNPANEKEEVFFYGNGTTENGTIEEYFWNSSIDGFLNNQESFSLSNLSNGTHTIYFKVKDNNNTWSDDVSETLIINGIPRAKIEELKPNPANESETVNFFGNYTDFENNITEFYWESDIEEFLSSQKVFSRSAFSNGTHRIVFRIKDNFNVWSENVTEILIINGIPRAKIENINPSPANESEVVNFYGNHTDFENNITEFYWSSNIDGLLSSQKIFSISNLSNGTHKILFRVKDNFNVWSENITEILTINGIPKAKIDETKPNPANESEIVYFYGNGTDDGTIKGYYWNSSIDGFLSNEKSINLSNLSNGTHTIYFKVIDNNNTWSKEFFINLIINGIPSAKIDEIKPSPANESEVVNFYGNYSDFEDNITEYYWESNIAGFLSNQKIFSISNLSNGTHKILFRVKDHFNVWSENVTVTLTINGIPKAIIDEVKPNPVNESEIVYFYGNGTDDGTIKGYYWNSSIDGFLSNEKSFSFSNLSNGTHTIYFKVKDNNNTWSKEFFINLIINGIPKAKIDEIKPSPANESEIVNFYGNYSDFENNITEHYWESNIAGFLSNQKIFSISNLSNGTHKILFRVKDNFNVWSENVTVTLTINGIPRAKIDEVKPNPANESEIVYFYGNGTDDGTIKGYYWNSSIDGFLSNEKSFGPSNLSNGTHTIYFKVKDNNNTWSKEVFTTLIINGIPRAKIDEINPNPANESKAVIFYGNYTDFENNITEYYWESDIEGFLSNQRIFSISNLSNGTHKILFRVKDHFNVWSENVTVTLTINGIPKAIIDEVKPNPTNESETVYFYGNGTDDGTIKGYYWISSIDGFLNNEKSFSLSNLSNGTHTIYFKVKDNNNTWSKEFFINLIINGIPRAKIDEIKPNPANESEIVYFYGNGTDDGTIENYHWNSSIDGFLSNEKSFYLSNLSNGTHTIYLKVKDNNNKWSKEVFTMITINGVPIGIIDRIKPNPANESERIWFYGDYKDFEDNIIGFYWESDINGFLRNQKIFSISNLTNGTHKIIFRVKDNFGVWSENVTEVLTINGIPRAKIDEFKPNHANESEIVYFYGNGTDDEEIVGYNWSSNIDNFLSNNNSLSLSNLSNGTHTIYFKVKDNNNVWSEEVSINVTINGIPIAKIDNIKPNPANESEIVNFYGIGIDDGLILEYYWNSSENGFLSKENFFTLSNLSNGTFTIYLKVKDNNNVWSETISTTLTINGIPRAKIDKIIPNFANESEIVNFYGSGTDDGTIEGYYWESNIDKFLSNKTSFSRSNLSNGTHTIYFKVKDNNNTWSDEIFTTLKINGIPRAEIDNINPNPANESEIVNFYGNGTDEGTIEGYYWESSIDNFLSNKTSFSLSNLSNGTHTIYFRVKDNNNVWSEEISIDVTINGIPIAKIDNIKPNPANESEIVNFYGSGIDDGLILEYYWNFSNNDLLSNENSFSLSNLSNGTHTIYFKVKDNNNVWSKEVFTTLTINGIPRAKIDEINPNPANEGEEIWFFGSGTDDGTIVDYEWRSNINGFLSNKNSFYLSNLSNGTHTIYFKVKDNNSKWSIEFYVELTIKPKPEEKKLKPYLSTSKKIVKVGETITFDASNSTGNIIAYFFDFGDGTNSSWVINSKINHTYSKEGKYIVKIKVKSANGTESDYYTLEVTVEKGDQKEEQPLIWLVLIGLIIVIVVFTVIFKPKLHKPQKQSEETSSTEEQVETKTENEEIDETEE